jgi:L-seryl-tRNA(Ser) seleniumtransferase
MKSEVIIQKSHRYPFDHQIRATGLKLVEVETREDVRKAINTRTAMMHFSNFANETGRVKVDEWVKLAKENNLPSFNDAAADVPPVSRLWEYVNMGYDLVTFSGGKAMRGPQCAGLLLGREDLVSYALLNNSPHEDTLGRCQKIGKEEIVGMVKAVELFLSEDQEDLLKEYWRRLDYISQEVTRIPGVSTAFHFNPKQIANQTVSMQIFWDPRRISITSREVSEKLKNGKPSIALGGGGRGSDGVGLSAWMLQPGEEKLIAKRLIEVLRGPSA